MWFLTCDLSGLEISAQEPELSVWPPRTSHEHGAILHFFTTKACLDQVCNLLLALRPSTLVWNAASQLTEDSTHSDFSTELWSAKICSPSDHSLSSLQNSADSQVLPSSCCSVQAGPFVFHIETYEWLKTSGKSYNMPYSLLRTL